MDVLVLGGTGRARRLAQELVDRRIDVVTSLAGVTASRSPVPGAVRVGGFGGVEGLSAFLRENRVRAVVDATHPFAGTMSDHAARAAAQVGLPLLRLKAPSWRGLDDARNWTWVAGHQDAAQAAREAGGRVLLTVGRQPVPHYLAALADRSVIARCIDAPDVRLPLSWTVLRDRGPFGLEAERALLAGVDVLVSKDSGGSEPDPKLVAAGELGTAVVMISRPPAPAYGEEVPEVAEALDRLVAAIV
ncbi:cobalt-precorrin-6A reductase [Acidipropionibacterium virtanenii]|uniref:Precorrin-6A reductase n=1 Tax=Acidipropionibacterium virtanenii TaxID=2057246 RepID=A0A344UWC7_9ACTN|nr:cobalt-precorrin-6A reductase [Acidipropionibacterium virtanenii]AXE39575.1 Precorrin-6A reductase [Acidipropionibacterium virtanenii]